MSQYDVSAAIEAKSDQLNAVDIMGYEPVIRIRDVTVRSGDQPVSIYFDGDNNRPWKPSKGMLRLMVGAWGKDARNWIGKYAKLYFEKKVRYAGKEVGGIRIRSLSDIPSNGLDLILTLNRQMRENYHVSLLVVEAAEYPEDKFQAGLSAMVESINSGKMTLQQVIAHCQKTGRLTESQLTRLQQSLPVVAEHEEENEGNE